MKKRFNIKEWQDKNLIKEKKLALDHTLARHLDDLTKGIKRNDYKKAKLASEFIANILKQWEL